MTPRYVKVAELEFHLGNRPPSVYRNSLDFKGFSITDETTLFFGDGEDFDE